MKKKKRSKAKKIEQKSKKPTTKATKPSAIPMRFNVLNFVVGSSLAKNRGVDAELK